MQSSDVPAAASSLASAVRSYAAGGKVLNELRCRNILRRTCSESLITPA